MCVCVLLTYVRRFMLVNRKRGRVFDGERVEKIVQRRENNKIV